MRRNTAFVDGIPDFGNIPIQYRPVMKDLPFACGQGVMYFKLTEFCPVGTFFPAFPGNGKDFALFFRRIKTADKFLYRRSFQTGTKTAGHTGEHPPLFNIIRDSPVRMHDLQRNIQKSAMISYYGRRFKPFCICITMYRHQPVKNALFSGSFYGFQSNAEGIFAAAE